LHANPTADARERFLQGMSCAAATVNVVTTDGPAGRSGVTVSAMSSVSADGNAPTLLVCVHEKSPTARTIIDNGCFCVNVLRDDQSFVSDVFAGRTKTASEDRFSVGSWATMTTGAPRFVDPLTAFDCKVISSERVGTHHVFIGEVQETFLATGGHPLIYAHRAYGSPVKINPARVAAAATTGGLRIGTLHTFGPYILPAILQDMEQAAGPLQLDLHEGDQRRLTELLRAGDIDLAFLYDFGIPDDLQATPLATLSPYVLLPDGHPLAAHERIGLADLLEERLVLLDAPPSRDYFLSLFNGVGEPAIAYRAQSFEMVRGMVAHGLGYSLLATRPASAMSYDGKALVTRPLRDQVRSGRMVLCQRRGAVLDRATSRFREHCIAILKAAAA
jgi:flavin reductase (DIM6/NTAB) family NADH-FMN oxidoreductase RutF/DNA-binding transcriptional LysR family regulator